VAYQHRINGRNGVNGETMARRKGMKHQQRTAWLINVGEKRGSQSIMA
jgi:hypothetical protein